MLLGKSDNYGAIKGSDFENNELPIGPEMTASGHFAPSDSYPLF